MSTEAFIGSCIEIVGLMRRKLNMIELSTDLRIEGISMQHIMRVVQSICIHDKWSQTNQCLDA